MSVSRLGDDDHGLHQKLGGPGGVSTAFSDPRGARLLRPRLLRTSQFSRILFPSLPPAEFVDVSNGEGAGGGDGGGDGGGSGDGSGAGEGGTGDGG